MQGCRASTRSSLDEYVNLCIHVDTIVSRLCLDLLTDMHSNDKLKMSGLSAHTDTISCPHGRRDTERMTIY